MKVRLLIICTVVAGSRLSAQDYPAPSAQRTSEVSDARFEIVQSPLSRSFTFRIDRYTGTVWQLTQFEKERWRWEETPLPDAPSVSSPNRARFQLHVSGLSQSQTILLDTESGKTWQFTKFNQTYPRQQGRVGYGWEVLQVGSDMR